jgi:uncharacterized SAM-binding protein YcdF (DUF218 family)
MTDDEITRLLFLRDEPGHTDLAIVFGHHDPTLSTHRARHAASLFLDGLTPRLLLTGGPTGRTGSSEAEFMARVVHDLGVPRTALLLEDCSRTTVENVALTKSLLAHENLLDSHRTVHLVSCPLHMRRVCHLARESFGPSVTFLSSPHTACCTRETWTAAPDCRSRVLAEVRLVLSLLDS